MDTTLFTVLNSTIGGVYVSKEVRDSILVILTDQEIESYRLARKEFRESKGRKSCLWDMSNTACLIIGWDFLVGEIFFEHRRWRIRLNGNDGRATPFTDTFASKEQAMLVVENFMYLNYDR